MEKITKIYLVTNCFGDPNKVYIGKTKNSRKKEHKSTYGNQIEYDYIDQVNSLDSKIWRPIETYWIQQFKAWGFEVLNSQKEGGSGVEFHTEEAKLKISKAKKGHKYSIEHNEKISKALKGKTRTEEQKLKMSKSHLGKHKHTEESKLKIKNSLIGRPKPKGTGAKIALKNKGNSCGPKGQFFSEETKKKMSMAKLGKKDSEETKLKRSISNSKFPFICIETNERFANLKEASDKLNISPIFINSVLKGKYKKAKGYTFKYIK